MEINITLTFFVASVLVLALMVGFSLLAYRVFMNRLLKEKQLQYQKEIAYQKKLLQQNIEIQEKERERIAVLLHDEVGNKLNVLSIWLTNPEAWGTDRLKEVVSKQFPSLIESTRTISHRLYPVNFEAFGLILSLENLIHNIDDSLAVNLIIKHVYNPRELAFEVQVYRIVQEFLSNVLKHSGASQFDIHIKDEKYGLALLLADNGSGIDLDKIERGMGLRNIELRLKSLNAHFKWKSQPNKGVRLIILLPKK